MKALYIFMISLLSLFAKEARSQYLIGTMLDSIALSFSTPAGIDPMREVEVSGYVINPDQLYLVYSWRLSTDSVLLTTGGVGSIQFDSGMNTPGWIQGLVVRVASGLTPGTKYYFASVVGVFASGLDVFNGNVLAVYTSPVSSWTTAEDFSTSVASQEEHSDFIFSDQELRGRMNGAARYFIFDWTGRLVKDGVVSGDFRIDLPPSGNIIRFEDGRVLKIPCVR